MITGTMHSCAAPLSRLIKHRSPLVAAAGGGGGVGDGGGDGD